MEPDDLWKCENILFALFFSLSSHSQPSISFISHRNPEHSPNRIQLFSHEKRIKTTQKSPTEALTQREYDIVYAAEEKKSSENVKKLILNGMRANIAWIWHNFYNAATHLAGFGSSVRLSSVWLATWKWWCRFFFFTSLQRRQRCRLEKSIRMFHELVAYRFFSIHFVSVRRFSQLDFTVCICLHVFDLAFVWNERWMAWFYFIHFE